MPWPPPRRLPKPKRCSYEKQTRKGLQDIRTRSSLTGEAENPQRKFLRVASLELKKSLCRKVRDAARKRAEEMDRKIAELDDEKAQLLASSQVSAARRDGSRCRPAARKRSRIAGAARLRVEILSSRSARCTGEEANDDQRT